MDKKILLLAFLIRVCLFLSVVAVVGDYSTVCATDTGLYIETAKSLIETGTFAKGGNPELLISPGYSVFLIFGMIAGNVTLVTIVLQIMLSCVTIYLLYRIGGLLSGNSNVAGLCALLYAIEPLSILYSVKLLTETLFTCLLVVFLYLLFEYLKKRMLRDLIFAAVVLAVAVYVRPIGYYLPLLVSVLLVLEMIIQREQNWILQLCHFLVFLCIAMGLIGLWQVRNFVQTGYAGFTTVADTNLYFYQGAAVLAAKAGVPYYQMQEQMIRNYDLDHPEQRTWSQSQIYQFWREQGGKIVFDNLGVYVPIHLKGILRVIFDPGAIEFLRLFRLYPQAGGLLGVVVDQGELKTLGVLFSDEPLVFWSIVVLGLYLAFYLVCGVLGLLSKELMSQAPAGFMLTFVVYFLAVSGGPQSLERFRHPIMPMVCIFSTFGICWIVERSRRMRRVSSKARARAE